MSFSNPTPIRIGMTGNISGRQYRVVGRVVLGEQEEGQTYYWNEFNLEDSDGTNATLVFEVTEEDGEWRLFHMFEPDFPLTAEDAATKRAGDPLNLEGTQVFVHLVSSSRVYHIEGKAPEGVEVGDVAHYFNAVTGNKMIVVSWTGDEVECYKGIDLSRYVVSSAFNVGLSNLTGAYTASGKGCSVSGIVVGVVVALCILTFALVGYRSFASHRRPLAFVKTPAPASRLSVGQNGRLAGSPFRVQTHVVAEVAFVGWKFGRHEYVLHDEEGTRALLICGSKPGAADWWLFKPLAMTNDPGDHPKSRAPLTPQEAAAVKWGQTVNINGTEGKVTELFQCNVHDVESPEASDLNAGDVFFGFTATTKSGLLLVRWNGQYINFFEGTPLSEKDVVGAFAKAGGK